MTTYKSEMCINWEMFGSCLYGSNCCFAHGTKELIEQKKGQNYRTRRCKNYWGVGCCMYGRRCRFQHATGQVSMTYSMLLAACQFNLSQTSRMEKWLPARKIMGKNKENIIGLGIGNRENI